MPDRHIVYATVKTPHRTIVRRVSRELSWEDAQTRWWELDGIRYYGGEILVTGLQVSHFSVRAANDPNWPSNEIECHPLVPSLWGGFDAV